LRTAGIRVSPDRPVLFHETDGVLQYVMDGSTFLRGFALALAAAIGTAFVLGSIRGLMIGADFQLRPSSIAEAIGGAVVLGFVLAALTFLPVLCGYYLAQRFRLGVVFYLLSAVVLACLTATLFADDPASHDRMSRWDYYLLNLERMLPSYLAGAFVFWWVTGRK